MNVLAELERGPRTLRSVKRRTNIERTNPPIYDIGELEFWITHWIGRVGRVLLETRAEDFIGEGVVLVYQGPDVW